MKSSRIINIEAARRSSCDNVAAQEDLHLNNEYRKYERQIMKERLSYTEEQKKRIKEIVSYRTHRSIYKTDKEFQMPSGDSSINDYVLTFPKEVVTLVCKEQPWEKQSQDSAAMRVLKETHQHLHFLWQNLRSNQHQSQANVNHQEQFLWRPQFENFYSEFVSKMKFLLAQYNKNHDINILNQSQCQNLLQLPNDQLQEENQVLKERIMANERELTNVTAQYQSLLRQRELEAQLRIKQLEFEFDSLALEKLKQGMNEININNKNKRHSLSNITNKQHQKNNKYSYQEEESHKARDSFIAALKSMVHKLIPTTFCNYRNIKLKQVWKFLKQVIQDYCTIKSQHHFKLNQNLLVP